MGKIRALLAAAVTVCGLLWGSVEVNAADVSGMEITSTADSVRKGQVIEFTFALDGYSDIRSGVNALKGTLEYDSAVFEKVSREDFQTVNSWEKLFYNPDNGQFVLINRAGSTEEEEVFRLRLTAGRSIPEGDVSVSVKELSVSEGKEDFMPADASFTLSAVAEYPDTDHGQTDGEQPAPDEEEMTPDNEQTEEGADSAETDPFVSAEEEAAQNGGGEEKAEENVKAGDTLAGLLPAAGALAGSAVLIGVLVFLRKKRKLSGRAKILAGVAACAGAAVLAAGSAWAFPGKGDLNDDGSTDYTDVELLEKHLIGLELLPEGRQRAADMNSDGKLTVTDLSLLIRRIEKTVDYEVKLSSATERFYYEKQEQAELKFYAEVSHDVRIEKVTVNGQEYGAETEGGSSLYTVRPDVGETSGVKEFHITEVQLEGGQRVKTDYTEKTDVLKSMPQVDEFLAEELTDTARMKVSFVLTDEDSAVTGAGIKIEKKPDRGTDAPSETDLIFEDEAGKGRNEFVLDLEEDTPYLVYITVNYDRESGDLPAEGGNSGSFAVTKEIELNLDYRFTFDRLQTLTEDGTRTDRFGRNQPIVLSFESTNATGFVPDRIVVNGKTCPVSRTDNGYRAILEGSDTTGENVIRVEQVILENGKSFSLNNGNEIKVLIQKTVPEIQELTVQEDAEKGQFLVSFRLDDPDSALSDRKVRIKKADGQTAGELAFSESDLHDGLFEEIIPLSDTGLTGGYTVQITADCDLSSDGTETVHGKILAEQTVKAAPRVLITDSRTDRSYIEKGEETDLFYELEHNAEGELTSLVIGHLEVKPERQNGDAQTGGIWKVSVPAPDKAGVHTFTLFQAVFSDGTVVNTEQADRAKLQTEVLKSVPSVENIDWEKTAQDELLVRFEIADGDNALENARVQIAEEGGRSLLDQTAAAGKQEVSAALTAEENYVITVTADYDRDTDALDDQSNEYKDAVLYTNTVSASKDALELKNITAERLYYTGGQTGGNTGKEVDVLDITGGLPADTENYYAVIEMDGLPDFYAGIREFRRDGDSGKVYAVLDQDGLVQYGKDGTRETGHAFPVAYRDGDGEYPLITGAEELFDRMKADPKGKFTLTEDLDASGIQADEAAVAGTFTGELDGNGYRIKNLPTSLFNTLSGARIYDLVIENADITAARSGILANTIQNSTVIENVFIVDSSISNGVDGLGAFAGRLVNSTIRESASLDVSVRGLVAVGGIVGKTEKGALIENCYVTGKVQGTYDHPSLGARTGGITGWHGGGTISRCYTQAQITAPAKKGNGGLIGGPNTGSPSIEYSLSMSTGAGYRIAGFDVLDNMKEVYEYSGSDSETNITEENQSSVRETDAVYDKKFYTDTLDFDESIWELDGLAYGKRPALKDAPVEENNFGLPNYSTVLKHENYRPDREQAYANMAKLMPLSDTRMWVEYGNRLEKDDELVEAAVRFILPLDENSALVTGVEKDAPEKIQKVRIAFENGTMREYLTVYKKMTGNLVPLYQVEGINLVYQPENYASSLDETFLGEMTTIAERYDYDSDIAGLTREEESRLYKDYYNENIKTDMADVLRKLFLSDDRYPVYCAHPAVQALAEERMRDEDTLKKMLYAWNYYDKWYRIDYRGVTLSELLFFHGELISVDMTASMLADRILSVPEGQRDTNRTVTYYNNVLKNYTGQELTDFLGNLSGSLAGYQDANEWFVDSFDGVLVEKGALGDEERKIRYRIWDNLKGLDDGRKSIVLPILTAPQKDMYLISVPSQIMIGSMNRYQDYLNKDGQERNRIRQTAEAYAEKMSIFYGVSSQWMSSAVRQLNSFVNIQYDTRLGFPESEAAAAGMQEKGTTRDPVMKWVYEANNMLNALNGSAAVANGNDVIWMWSEALGTSDYTFFTFSHETAHNQDGRYFYGGAGRRPGTGAEAHADGNIAQEMRDGVMVFNISKSMDIGVEMPNNFSYKRIDSAKKIHSYYKEMFDTGYALDYLAAQAFLRLTPQQQAAVAVQAEHTAGGTASMSTVYRKLTAEEISAMKLEDMEDLWENRISVRSASSYPEKVGTATDGSYGFESFYTMNWYQSHNDDGSPDTHSFKRLGQEMLGLAGYEKGYMVYMSALSKNDLEALRTITGDPDITWKEYKLNRYREVEAKLGQIPYFEAETVIEQFKAAFEEDAGNGGTSQSIETKRMLYGMIKRVTGDFADGGIYKSPSVTSITSAEQLIRLAGENPYGYYRLENSIDFSNVSASGGSYIPDRFVGVLDGNGYEMTGMEYPLLKDLQYAQVKNLTISDPSYAGDAEAILAVKSRKVTVGNIRVENADMPLPLVKTRTEGYYEYGDMSITVGEKKIATAEEFLAIGDSAAALKKQYVLTEDLDFGTIGPADFVVKGTFSGGLKGNGHTITGLDGVLFEKINGGSVSDLTIEGTRLTRNTQKGALANEIRNADVQDIRIKDLVIENNTDQAGGLAGIISGSTVKRIAVENISARSSNTIGGVAGQFDGRILEDCIVTGSLEGTIRHQMGTRIGGITGWMGGGTMKKCLAKVEIIAPERTGNGGIIGGPQSGSAAVESCVSLSTGMNASRISGWDVLGTTSSAYELDSSDSRTSINEANADRIFPVTEQQAMEKTFYTETLGWSEAVWDFSALAAGGLPALR